MQFVIVLHLNWIKVIAKENVFSALKLLSILHFAYRLKVLEDSASSSLSELT